MSSRWRWGPGWGWGRWSEGGGSSCWVSLLLPGDASESRTCQGYLPPSPLVNCLLGELFPVADWPKCQSRSLGKRYSRLDRGEIGRVPEASLYIGVGTSFHPHPGASINRVRKRTGIEIVGADDEKVKVWKSANLTSLPNPSYTQLGT